MLFFKYLNFHAKNSQNRKFRRYFFWCENLNVISLNFRAKNQNFLFVFNFQIFEFLRPKSTIWKHNFGSQCCKMRLFEWFLTAVAILVFISLLTTDCLVSFEQLNWLVLWFGTVAFLTSSIWMGSGNLRKSQ